MKKDLYTIQEVSSILGVSPKTLRRWEESGIIQTIRTAGNQRRYHLEEIKKVERRRRLHKIKQEVQKEIVSEPVLPELTVERHLEEPFIRQILPEPVQQISVPESLPEPELPFYRQYPIKKAVFPFVGGVFALVLLFSLIPLWQQMGLLASHSDRKLAEKTTSKQAVLAATTATPAYQLAIDVPGVFGKQVSFLSTVSIKKSLTVAGQSVLKGGITTDNANINAGKGKLTASNVIYSILAGSNITISGDKQNPKISANAAGVTSLEGVTGDVSLTNGSGISLNGLEINNTGVLTFQGTTGDVTLSPGDGIDITGTTITNTDTGSAQNIFKTFTINGTDITASNNNDTVSFAAGSGISLTGDADSKTITIASSGGGGGGGLSGLTTNGVLYATSSTTASSVVGTNGTVLHGVTGGAPVFGAVDLTSDVANILPLANGGTGVGGATVPTNGQILIGNGSGYQLGTITQGSGIGIANGSGTITLTNSGVLSLTGTANQVNVSASTGNVTLSLPQDIAQSSAPTFASATFTSNTNQLILGSGTTGTISMDTLTGNRTYTFPDASGEVCLTSGNCSGSGGSLTGSGTTNFIPKFTSSSGVGDSSIFDNGKIGIGTTSPEGLFSVSGTAPGFALTELNQTGSGDILTGSSSGATRFTFDANGDLNIIGGAYQIGGVTTLSSTALGTSVVSSSLTSVGALSGGSISSGFGSIDVGTDTISGGDITSTGTTGLTASGNGAGLTFSGSGNHIISASSGTLKLGAATLTGGIAGNAQNITGLGSINGLTITPDTGTITTGIWNGTAISAQFGGTGINTSGATGVPYISGGTWTVDTNALAATHGGTGQTGYTVGDLLYANTTTSLAKRAIGSNGQILTVSGGVPVWSNAGGTINFWQENSGAVEPFDITDDLLLGSTATSSAKFAFENVAGGTPTASISANNGNNSTYLTGDGTLATTNRQTLTLGSASTGNVDLFGFGAGVVHTNASGFLSTALVQNTELQNSSLTITTNTGLSGGGVVSLGGSLTLTNTGVTSAVAGTGISVSGSTGAVTITNSGVTSLTGTTDQVAVTGATGAITLSLPQNIDSTATPTFAGLTLSNFTSAGGPLYTNGSGVLAQVTAGTAHQLLHGGAIPSYAAVDLTTDVTGTLPVANGGTNAGSIGSNGALAYSNGSAYAFTAVGGSGQVLESNGGGAPTWVSSGSVGTNYFQLNNGALSPVTSSNDLLLGSTATNSAKFAFENVGSGTPVASISANNGNNATYLTGDGTLATTNKQGLTIGSASTGNIGIFGIGTGVVQSNSGLLSTGLVQNSELQNNSLTINTGTGLSGGGAVALGGTLSLTNTGVTSALAGTGISVSGATGAVTISNAGVTSLAGTANQVAVTSGTGAITLSLPQNIDSGATPTFTSLNLSSFTSAGGPLYTNGSGALAQVTAGTNHQLLHGGATPTFGAVDLTSDVAGILPVANGGTGANLTLSSLNAQGSIPYFNGSGVMTTVAIGGISTCLTSNGSTPVWASCSGVGTNFFQLNNGAISPLNSTNDLLLGSTATSSAKFAFENVAGGTPTASISANTANNSTYVTGDGTLATTDRETLTLGSASTGNIDLFGFGSGVVHTSASGVLSTGLVQNSDLQNSSITITSSTGLSGGGIVSLGGSLTLTNTGVTSAVAGTGISLSGGTGAVTITNAGVTALTGTLNQVNVSASTGSVTLSLPQDIGTGSSPTFAGLTLSNFTSAGGPLYTNGSGVLAQATAGTAHQLLHGGATPTFGAVDLTDEVTGLLPLANGGTNANLTADNGGIVYSGSSGLAILTHNANSGLALVSGASGAPSWFAPTQGSLIFAGASGALNQSNSQLFFDNTKSLFGLGTATPVSKLDVEGLVAGKALSIFNYTGTDQNILVASTSGTEEFAVNNNGNVQFAGNSGFINTLTTTGTFSSGQSYSFPTTGGTVCILQASNCSGSGGTITGSGTTNRLVRFTASTAIGDGSINDLGSAVALTIDATGNIGIGTTTPTAQFQVNGSDGGNAAIIVNQLNSGDIFSASSSGATEFTISNNGSIEFNGGSGFTQTITSGATAGKTYNFPDFSGATADVCLSTGNCAGSGSGVTGSGVAGQVAFFTGTSSISSDSTVFFDNTKKLLGIGTGTPVSKLDVEGAVTGKALAIFNTTGDQAIFSASSSGTARFTVGNDGTLTATKYTTNGGLLYTDGSGNVQQIGSVGTTHQVLHGGTSPAYSAVDLTADVTNTLPVANGGTGVGSFGGTNTLLYTTSANTLASLTTVNNSTLITNGSGVPSWASATGDQVLRADGSGNVGYGSIDLSKSATVGSSVLPIANGGTNANSIGSNGALAYSNGSAYAFTAVGGSGQVLESNGGGAPTWVSAGSVGTNYFQLNSGALAPANITNDLLLGSTATASAKFAFENVAVGIPTASISANTANNSLYVTGDGTLATTDRETLTLGSSSTGNVDLFGFGAGVIHSNASGVLSTGLVQNSELQNNSVTINTGTGLSGGGAVALGGTLSLTNTGVTSAVAGTGISVSGATGAVTITNSGVTSLTGTTDQVAVTGATGAITLSLPQNIDSTATPTFAGLTLSNFTSAGGPLYTNGSGVLAQVTAGTAHQLLHGGAIPSYAAVDLTSDVTGLLPITNGGTNGNATPTAGAIAYGTGSAYAFSAAGSSGQILVSGGTGAPTWVPASSVGTNYFQLNGSVISPATLTNSLAVGTTTTLASSLDVRALNGTQSIASVAGSTSFAGLLVDNTGSGDLFTASKSGATKFVIANNGNVGIGIATPAKTLDVAGTLGVSGAATVGTLNGLTVTNNGTNTLTIAAGKTLTDNNNLTFAGTDGKTLTINGSTTLADNVITFGGGETETLTAGKSLSFADAFTTSGANPLTLTTTGSTNVTLPVSGTLATLAGTESLTNKTVNGLTLTANADGFSVAGGTTSRTLTVSGNDVSLNQNLLTTSTPTFGGLTLSGFTSAGGPLYTNGSGVLSQVTAGTAHQLLHGGATPSFSAVDLTSDVTGILPVANGGTGANLTLTSLNAQGSIPYFNVSGVLTTVGIGGTSSCLTSNGSVPVWASCSGVGTNFWQVNSGALAPLSITNDLLLGGTSTASAKFAFINNAGGSPTASISGNLSLITPTGANPSATFNVLNGGSLNFQTSVGGDAGLTSRLFIANNGNVGIGTAGPAKTLDITGTLNVSSAATVGTINGLTVTNNGTNTLTIAAGKTLTDNNSLTFAGTDGKTLTVNGSTTLADNAITFGGGETATLTTGKSISFADAFTTSGANPLTLTTTGSTNVTLPTTGTLSTLAGTETLTNKTIGNTNNITLKDTGFTLQDDGDTSKQLNFQLSGITTGNIRTLTIPDASGTICLQNSASCGFALGTNYWQLNGSVISPATLTNSVAIGTTTGLASGLDVRALNGTQSIASVSGSTSYAGLIVDNTGTGDLFTASKSGATKFVIANSGNVGIGTSLPAKTLDIVGTLGVSGAATVGTINGLTVTNSGTNTLTIAAGKTFTENNNLTLAGTDGKTLTVNGSTTLADNVVTFGGTETLTLTATKNVSFADAFSTSGANPLTLTTTGSTNVTLPTTGTLSTLAGTETLTNKTLGTTNSITLKDTGFTLQDDGDTTKQLNFQLSGITTGNIRTLTVPDASGTICLQSSASCGFALGTNYFQQNSNAISQLNVTNDLLLGGTATTSAKFAFINNASGIPVASISAQSGSAPTGLAFSGNGSIQSLNDNTLTIGGATTGNIVIDSGTNITQLADNTIQLTGTSPTISSTNTLTINAFTLGGTLSGGNQNISSIGNITANGSGNTITGFGTIGTTGTTNFNGNILTLAGNAGADITTNTANSNLTLTPNGSGNTIITSDFNTGVLVGSSSNTIAPLSVSGGIGNNAALIVNNINNGNLITASASGATKFSLTNAGALNVLGGLASDIDTLTATSLKIGATTATSIALGNASAVTTAVGGLTVSSGKNLTLAGITGNNAILYATTGTGVVASAVTSTANQCLLSGAGAGFAPTWGTCSLGTNYFQLNGSVISPATLTNSLAVGTTTSLASGLDVRALNGTQSIASVAGSTSFAGLLVDNTGSGDLFTASKSGATKFVITNAGNVGIGTSLPAKTLDIAGTLGVSGAATVGTLNGLTVTNNGTNTLTIAAGKTFTDNNNLTLAGTDGKTLTLNGSTTLADNVITFGGTETLTLTATKNVSFADAFTTSGANPLTLTTTGSTNVTLPTTGTLSTLAGTETLTNKTLGNTNAITLKDTNFMLQDDGDTTKQLNFQLSGITTGNIRTLTVPDASGTLCLQSSASCGFALGTNYWQLNSNAISPFNITNDLLLGGTATASAKFAFLNNAGGTPVASISANNGNIATYLTGDGTLSTTNRQTLSLGSASTGNVSLIAGGATDLTASSNGDIGIGTATPVNKLDIAGTAGVITQMTTLDNTSSSFASLQVQADNPVLRMTVHGSARVISRYGLTLGGWGEITLDKATSNPNGLVIGTQQAVPLVFGTNNLERLRIDGSGNVGIGTTTPLATLDLRGNSGTTPVASVSGKTTNAGLIVDNGGSGDIFTASASGATRLTLTNGGTLKLVGGQTSDIDTITGTSLKIGATNATSLALGNASAVTTAVGGLTVSSGKNLTLAGITGNNQVLFATNGTGVAAGVTATSTANQCLLSGASTPVWGSCDLGTTSWVQLNGTIYSGNSTEDLLVGGIATASAKFAFINVTAGTPTASISAGTTGGTYLNATGTLATTAKQSLTLGDSNTGNIQFYSSSNTITSAGNLTLAGTTGINLTGNSADINFSGTGASTITTGSGQAFALMPGGSAGVGINTTTPLASLDVRGNLGTTPVASVSGSTAFASLVVDQSGSGDLFTASKSGATKFVIANNGNVGVGTATPLDTFEVNAGNISGNGIKLDGTGQDLDMQFNNFGTNGQNWTLDSGGNGSFNGAGYFSIGTFGNSPVVSVQSFSSASTGGLFGINNPTFGNPSTGLNASLDVRNGQSTLATASFSGASTFANTVIDQSGTGDLFTASKSGATKFTISNNGNVTSAGNLILSNSSATTTFGGIAYTWPGSQAAGAILEDTGSGVLSWVAPGTLPSSNFWNQINGVLTPDIETQDLLLGSTATASADFAFTGVNTATPVASVSAFNNSGNKNAISLNASLGTIQTANNNTLNIGGATTGNIILSPLNGGVGSNLTVNAVTSTFTGTTTITASSLATLTTASSLSFGSTTTLTLGGNSTLNGGNGASSTLTLAGSSNGSPTNANILLNATGQGRVGINTTSPLATLDVRGNSGTTPVASISGKASFASLVVDQSGSGDLFTASSSGFDRFVIDNAGDVGVGVSPQHLNGSVQNGLGLGTNIPTGNLVVAGAIQAGDQTQGFGAVTLTPGRSGASGTVGFYDTSGNNDGFIAGTINGGLELATEDSNYLQLDGGFGSTATMGINTSSSPLSTLDVRASNGTISGASISGKTSFAEAVIDQSGTGAILAASSAGKTKFLLNNNGSIQVSGGQTSDIDTITGTSLKIGATNATSLALGNASAVTTAVGGLTVSSGKNLTLAGITGNNQVLFATNGTGVAAGVTATSTANQCLLSGASTPIWGSCDLGTTSWVQLNGTIYPGNSTEDLLVGGTATASADFAITGVDTATPVASISAFTNSGNKNGISLNASTSTIQSLNHNTLTLGGTTTGNILLDSGTNVTQFADNTLSLTGSAPVIGATTTNAAVQLNANGNGLLTLNGNSDTGNIQFFSGSNTLTSAGVLTIAGAGNALNLAGAGANINFSGAGTAEILTASNQYLALDPGGAGNIILNSTATPLASLDVRANSGTLAIASVSGSTSFAGLLVDNTGSGDLFTASKSGASKFVITNSGSVGIGTVTPVDSLEVNAGAVSANGIKMDGTAADLDMQFNNAGTSGQNWVLDSAASGSFNGAGTFSFATFGNSPILSLQSELSSSFGGLVGINDPTFGNPNTALAATLDVRSGKGTLPTASFSGSTSFAGLVVNNSGSGDLFTASSAGRTKFTVTNSGNVFFGGDTISASASGSTNNGSPAVISALPDEGSLIPNASFEADSSGSQIGDGWVPSATSSALMSLDTNQSDAAIGGNSLRYTSTSASAQSEGVYSACIETNGGLGTTDMTLYAKASGAGVVTVRMYMDSYSSKANCMSNTSPAVSAVNTAISMTTSYQDLSSTPISTGTWGRAHIFFASNTNGVTANVDGVRLFEATSGQGLDYAEDYPADPNNTPQPGQVVSLEASGSAAIVVPSAQYMDQSAIGVVSTKPGEVLDDGSVTNPVPIALSGRVPVNVSTANGPIQVGDYLASSTTPGVAVKAINAGSVIGTAMSADTDTNTSDVQQVTVLVKNTYYPGPTITDTGNLNIFENTPGIGSTSGLTQNPTYGIKDQNGNAITQNAAYANAAIGNLQAGGVTAQTLNVQNLVLAGQSVNDRLNDLENSASNSAQLSTKVDTLSTNVNSLSDRLASDEAMLNLLASGSALLNENPMNFAASSAAELNLDQLTANNAVINKSLSVLGKTTVADLGVTGNITAGLISIDGLDGQDGSGNAFASINTSSGPLKIQSFGFNGVDFENGKLTIAANGDLSTQGQITTTKLNIDTGNVAGASLGIGTLAQGKTSVTIDTAAVSSQSAIFVTSKTKTNQQLSVTSQTAGKSFIIETTSPASEDIKFNWWIVN